MKDTFPGSVKKYDTFDVLSDPQFSGKGHLEKISTNKQGANGSNIKKDFFAYWEAYIEDIRPRLALCTYRGYLSEVSKLKKFRNEISISHLDRNFIVQYEHYMLDTLKNKNNTVNRTFRRLKPFIKHLQIMEVISCDPFKGYKMLNSPSLRQSLSWEELSKIEQLKTASLKCNQQRVLYGFLFSCYTGLRFKDVSRIQANNVINSVIIMSTSKTGSVVRIPLSERAIAISTGRVGLFFRMYSNHKTNKILGQLMLMAGISRKVTFHIARHTFATLSLNLGIPMEVLSGLLGHTSLRTTQVYAKIQDKTRIEMMKKWDAAEFF